MRALSLLAALAILLVVPCACSTMAAGAPGSGKLVHVVAFWFKPSAPKDLAATVSNFYRTRVQGRMPGVEAVWVGPPQPSDRDVVDDSFSLMSVVRFTDHAAEVAWQTHPIHDELRRLFEPHLAKVTVYDFVE
jgi:hypothetical protein